MSRKSARTGTLPERLAGHLLSFLLIPNLVPLWLSERKNFEAVQLS
jgi:hypothetical protein